VRKKSGICEGSFLWRLRGRSREASEAAPPAKLSSVSTLVREAPDPKLDRRCFFIVRDARGQALAYVYFEEGTRGGQAPHQ
jgi:hypothetical protein